uniref:Short-chain dehydrogenase/reductase SDR n=1 Tax=Solibacter usitatus (strain Ellin6076) TaxID=234267 RepID=Q022W1_SOLUE
MSDRELKGMVVVITGASSGFGKGCSLRFAREGCTVVLAARRDQLLDRLAQECEAFGNPALPVPTDVSLAEDVAGLAERALGEFGRIDVWVNNAGAGAIGRFEDVPLEDHVKVIQTDLLGTLYGSYFAMTEFRRQGQGTLINLASVIGKVPSPYFASYAAAKHGVVGLSASLRQELEQDQIDTIRVCTVMPTTFDTPFFEHAAQYSGKEASPIPPTYDPSEVVDTIVSLAKDPKDEVSVGTAAKVATFAHQFFPGMVEAMMARQTRKAEFDEATTGEHTSGSLHEPMPTGTSIGGGWKK